MRHLLLGGVIAAVLTLTSIPAGAATDGGIAALRGERQALVRRIAALTDDAERARLRIDDANRRRAVSLAALVGARRRFARHAVNAYLGGVQQSETDQMRRKAWSTVLSATDGLVLNRLLVAKAAAEHDSSVAVKAIALARDAATKLDAARVVLERTIADRALADGSQTTASIRDRTAAMSSTRPALLTRHQIATGSQLEVMRRYRFGLVQAIPPGLSSSGQLVVGNASWYGPGFDGRATASGAIFDQEGWTVASRTLPLGTILLITRGDRSVLALVNDRGPYVAGRVLDLSHGVAAALGTVSAGVAAVRAEVLVPA